MPATVLIAGIGNIFQGDDAFGVTVVKKLAAFRFPEYVKVMDIGIRSIDLGFGLLAGYDLTILVDATTRGRAPGTLYTIEIQPDYIPDICDETAAFNSHSLDPVRVLALAKSMGAKFKRVLLIGCEPLVVDHDESGHIGLSEVVQSAVDRAVDNIRQLVQELIVTTEQEVYSRERV
jgi:hydrogenase maturation protease